MAISFSVLTSGSIADETATTENISPIYTPTLIGVAQGQGFTGTPPDEASVAGCNLTWTVVGSVPYATRRRLTVLRGDGTPTSGQLSITGDLDAIDSLGLAWFVIESPSIDSLGTSASSTNTSGTATVTLVGSPGANDASLAFVALEDSNDPSWEVGLDELADVIESGNVRRLSGAWDIDHDATPSATFTTTGWGMVGFYVFASAGGGSSLVSGSVSFDGNLSEITSSLLQIKSLMELSSDGDLVTYPLNNIISLVSIENISSLISSGIVTAIINSNISLNGQASLIGLALKIIDGNIAFSAEDALEISSFVSILSDLILYGNVDANFVANILIKALIDFNGTGNLISSGSVVVPNVQYARPDSDISSGSWLNELGGSSNLYQSIDEVNASDSDYIISGVYATDNIVEFTLSDVNDPGISGSHILKYRYSKSGTDSAELIVELLDGAVTTASWTHNIADQIWHDAVQTLTSGQADSISDYSNLRLRFTARQP